MSWIPRLPHPGTSVAGFFSFFSFLFCFCCFGATWLEQPLPLAIQLWLKDSSCAVLCPCTQRSHCYNPREDKPAVTAPCYTLLGNFKQTSSRGGWFSVRRPCAHSRVSGTKCQLCSRCQFLPVWQVVTWVCPFGGTQTHTLYWLTNDPCGALEAECCLEESLSSLSPVLGFKRVWLQDVHAQAVRHSSKTKADVQNDGAQLE